MSLHESAREALANADAALACELLIALIYEDGQVGLSGTVLALKLQSKRQSELI